MNQTPNRKRAATYEDMEHVYDTPACDEFDREKPSDNRATIPLRFYNRWNNDIDNAMMTANDYANIPAYMPMAAWKDENDSNFARKWKRYFNNARDKANNSETFPAKMLRLDSTLRKALCNGDYMTELYEQMKHKQEETGRRIAELEAENRRLKREGESMREHLREYEENNEQMIWKEEEMRRSRFLERSTIRPKEKPIDAIQVMCERASPSVAELRKHFADQGELKLRPPKPPGVPLRDESRRPREIELQRVKYARRSKSVTRHVGILKRSNDYL